MMRGDEQCASCQTLESGAGVGSTPALLYGHARQAQDKAEDPHNRVCSNAVGWQDVSQGRDCFSYESANA